MMRRPLTTLMLVTCGLLVLAAVAAVGATLMRDVHGHADADARTWPFTLSPTPDDFSLAEISFRVAGGGRSGSRSLSVAGSGPFGDDYMAAAYPRVTRKHVVDVLVMLVNRPSALMDPVSVHLRVSTRRSLGKPVVHTVNNVFGSRYSAHTPALCKLHTSPSGVTDAQLSRISSRGAPLTGLTAAGAVAQAYDVVCHLPHSNVFRHAVNWPSPRPSGPEPAPPAPEPPVPPVGKLPGEGCVPAPGYACPEAVTHALPARAG